MRQLLSLLVLAALGASALAADERPPIGVDLSIAFEVAERSLGGRIRIPAAVVGARALPGIEPIDAVAICESGGTSSWRVTSIGHPDGRSGGRPLGEALAHELGHALFGLPDEYHIPWRRSECSRERDAGLARECPGCLMGPAPVHSGLVLCGAGDHNARASQLSCREQIVARYPGVRFPNPAWDPARRPPPVVFTPRSGQERDGRLELRVPALK
jgi:hypothetical protein